MRRDSVSVQVLGCVIREVVRLHSTGYVHRDIEPNNILLYKGQPGAVLTNFGCAAKAGAGMLTTVPCLKAKEHHPFKMPTFVNEPSIAIDIVLQS